MLYGEPVPDAKAPTKRIYEVGEWREAVVYKSNSSASAIGGYPYDVKAVKTLVIEEGVTKIGSFTAQFPNLTGEVVIPSTVTYIGQEAFYAGSKNTTQNISKLTFAAGGTAPLCIANGAFKSVEITGGSFPGDRSEIHVHHWAFGGSPNLKRAYIPGNITKTWGGEHVDYFDNFNSQTNPTWTQYGSMFTGCTAMETITFENEDARDLFFAKGRQSTAEDYIVAYVGLTAYNTVGAVAEVAKSGDTVVLVKSSNETVVLPAGVILNKNGKEAPDVTVEEKKVAKIGETGYATLTVAALDGETVTLVNKVALEKEPLADLDGQHNTYFNVAGKSITVNLNGKTISGEYTDTDRMLVGLFSTANAGHLTLNGSGTVNVTSAEGAAVYSLIANYNPACSIVINGGDYTLDEATDSLVWSHPSADEGVGNVGIVVNGGNFTLGNVGSKGPDGNGSPWIFNANGRNSRHIWVTGGTFNADVSNQYWKLEVQMPDNCTLVGNGEGTWTVVSNN